MLCYSYIQQQVFDHHHFFLLKEVSPPVPPFSSSLLNQEKVSIVNEMFHIIRNTFSTYSPMCTPKSRAVPPLQCRAPVCVGALRVPSHPRPHSRIDNPKATGHEAKRQKELQPQLTMTFQSLIISLFDFFPVFFYLTEGDNNCDCFVVGFCCVFYFFSLRFCRWDFPKKPDFSTKGIRKKKKR